MTCVVCYDEMDESSVCLWDHFEDVKRVVKNIFDLGFSCYIHINKIALTKGMGGRVSKFKLEVNFIIFLNINIMLEIVDA